MSGCCDFRRITRRALPHHRRGVPLRRTPMPSSAQVRFRTSRGGPWSIRGRRSRRRVGGALELFLFVGWRGGGKVCFAPTLKIYRQIPKGLNEPSYCFWLILIYYLFSKSTVVGIMYNVDYCTWSKVGLNSSPIATLRHPVASQVLSVSI